VQLLATLRTHTCIVNLCLEKEERMKGVLFVITSPRPHTHPAYGLIQDMMAQTTTHADRFVFADSPSETCSPEQMLRRGWDELTAASDDVILPAFKEGKNVVISQGGFDLLLAVLHRVIDPDERARLIAMHHSLEQGIMRRRGIQAPLYLSFHGVREDDFVELRKMNKLDGCDNLAISEYLHRRALFIKQYFDDRHQNTPFWFNTSDSAHGALASRAVKQMCEMVPGTRASQELATHVAA
jgi:hypothetical protein